MEWHPLPAFPGLPPLLVAADLKPLSYTLHITDLAHVWTETLDEHDIRARSLREKTSIDLTADADQWAVFMSKLRDAVNPTSPHHHLTTLSLTADPSSSATDALLLRIACELPAPLSPLTWPVKLTRCPSSTIASDLVLPLIHSHHVQSLRIDDLVSQLKAKDAVIDKFIDKLEAMNTRIENVFTSLSAKHSLTREAAESKVKGLGPFNYDEWKSRHPDTGTQDTPDLRRTVFGRQGLHRDSGTAHGVSDTLDYWWMRLGRSTEATIQPRRSSPRTEMESSINGDEPFQIQSTTPATSSRPSARGKTTEPNAKNDETTESDDSEAPESRPVQSPHKLRSKIGAVGNKKKPTPGPPVGRSSRVTPHDQDETASESDEQEGPVLTNSAVQSQSRSATAAGRSQSSATAEIKSPLPVHPQTEADDETASDSDSDSNNDQPARPVPVSRKGGLGRIGGNSKPESPQPKSHTPDDDEDVEEAPTKVQTRKLGAIGKRLRPVYTMATSKVSAAPRTETDEQKAERKRTELAKELEGTRATAPTKKKRKF